MTSGRRRASALSALDADDAIIALLIAAMDASGHVSPEEAARAHIADTVLQVIRLKNSA